MFDGATVSETWRVRRRFKSATRSYEPGQTVEADEAQGWRTLASLRRAGYITPADLGSGHYRVLRHMSGHAIGDAIQLGPKEAYALLRFGWIEHANVDREGRPLTGACERKATRKARSQ